jgi:hypothetical protein
VATSVVAAVTNFYDAMSFPSGVDKPPMYFGFAPTRATNVLLRLPYVVIRSPRRRTWQAFGTLVAAPNRALQTYEIATVTLESFAVQYEDAQAVADGIKWGPTIGSVNGLDNGVLVMTPMTFKACRRVDEMADIQEIQTEDVQLCHRVMLTYEIEMQTVQ